MKVTVGIGEREGSVRKARTRGENAFFFRWCAAVVSMTVVMMNDQHPVNLCFEEIEQRSIKIKQRRRDT